ncbi:unnamed protein product, partial [Symbiodinium microadriaticum]
KRGPQTAATTTTTCPATAEPDAEKQDPDCQATQLMPPVKAHARHAKNRNVTKDTAGETQEQGQEILPSTMAAIKAAEQGDSENAQLADNKHESPTGMPMLGDRIMVTNEAWLAVILSGTKSMEVRRAPVQTGPTWIGHEGQIYASANITECRELSEEDYEKSRAQHLHLSRMKTGDRLYGLLLTDIVQLTPPVEYYRRPTRSIWEVFKTGPDDKLPRGKAAKRHLHMPALQDHETGVENKDNSTRTNTAEQEEDDDDDADDINDEKGGPPQGLHEHDYGYTLQEEVHQFVQAVMQQELEPEQLKWWQDTLKERCRYHRFPCRAWFELVYQWHPPTTPAQPAPGQGTQRPWTQQVVEDAVSRAQSLQTRTSPTTYSIPCYVPVLLNYERN